ncbi:hypothetical protein CR513_32529, partial [Mucuna pruriens]
MTVRTKIDVHVGTLSMEFGDNLVHFNIFETMKHPTEDPSLFGNDVIDELVMEYMQLETDNAEFSNFAEDIDVINCLGVPESDSSNHPGAEFDSNNQSRKQLKAESNSVDQMLNLDRVGELKLRPTNEASPLHSPPIELKSLPGHLKYAYLDNDQQFPIIIANNLHWEQEDKLLQILRQPKKAIGW